MLNVNKRLRPCRGLLERERARMRILRTSHLTLSTNIRVFLYMFPSETNFWESQEGQPFTYTYDIIRHKESIGFDSVPANATLRGRGQLAVFPSGGCRTRSTVMIQIAELRSRL
jgi:hypothetical protein